VLCEAAAAHQISRHEGQRGGALLEERARGAGMRLAEWVRVLEVEPRLQVYYCNTLIRELGGWPTSEPTPRATKRGALHLDFEMWDAQLSQPNSQTRHTGAPFKPSFGLSGIAMPDLG